MTTAATERRTHTPGPWSAVAFGKDGSWDVHRKTPTLDGGYFARVEPLHHATREARDEAEANARLIAAAPDLLAACNFAYQALTDRHGAVEDDEAIEALTTAIAKAQPN